MLYELHRLPGLFQSSQATILELWASLHLLDVPGTQIDTSRNHPETQKTTKLDRNMPPAESRLGLFESSQATVLEL